MSRQPGFQRGDRIALEYTADPYTQLQPGDQGTVTGYESSLGQLNIRWDSGSTLAMLLHDGDQVRLVTPASGQAASPGRPPGPPPAGTRTREPGEPVMTPRATCAQPLTRTDRSPASSPAPTLESAGKP